MKTVRIYEILPEKRDAYFKSVKENFELCSAFKYILGKAEAGSTRSERGYQLVASTTVEQLARTLGCNVDEAVALSMAVGFCFPKYGSLAVYMEKRPSLSGFGLFYSSLS